jgi:hypothetical protein
MSTSNPLVPNSKNQVQYIFFLTKRFLHQIQGRIRVVVLKVAHPNEVHAINKCKDKKLYDTEIDNEECSNQNTL